MMEDLLYEELLDDAQECMMLHPDCTEQEWVDIMIDQYGLSVVDALGTNEKEVRDKLSDLYQKMKDNIP